MKEQKLHDVNFLLNIVEKYLKKYISPEVEDAHQQLLAIKHQLQKQ
ncbi:MAG: hypothetical protein GY828_02025 [Candidatus Gracilibacteria bacterium]|nr:hypothetical protein [Candidatus Gracilibacteria bacterium]